LGNAPHDPHASSTPIQINSVNPANGKEVLAAYEQHQPNRVLIDIVIQEMGGIQATWRIHGTYPLTRIVVH